MTMTAPTVQLSTISAPEAAPAPAAPPDVSNGAAPPVPAASEGASGAGAKVPDVELSRRLGEISKKEAKQRRSDTEYQEKMAGLAAREKELEAKHAELDGALGDPVKYMLDKGRDPVEVAKRFSEPETALEKEVRSLKERETKREEAERLRTEAAEEQRAKAEHRQVVHAFVGEITEDNAPNLTALYEATEVPGLVTELLNRAHHDESGEPTGETLLQAFRHTHGRSPTNAEIRRSLESEAETRATKIIESHKRRSAADSSSQASETGQSQTSKTEAGPSGISNTHASVTSSAKPKKPTLEERRKKAKTDLTEALEAEATERT